MSERVETVETRGDMTNAMALPELEAGNLAVDFVNTVEWRGRSENRGDYLDSYDALLRWCEHAGALGPDELEPLAAEARTRPDAARTALGDAIALREALAVLLPVRTTISAEEEERRARALPVLNGVVATAMRSPVLEPRAGGYGWSWPGSTTALDAPTWPVARAAAELLSAPGPRWIRACENEECGWLFVDESRGHRRRWCSMATCGNRAKARRHYARRRGGGAARTG